jgi:hypothetical protein
MIESSHAKWMVNRRMIRLYRICLGGFALLLMLAPAVWPQRSQAHSGGAPQLTNEPAGPYRVYAWTLPDPWQVGEAHVSLIITIPATEARQDDDTVVAAQPEQVVTDAEIMVRFDPVDQPEAAPFEVAAKLGTDISGIYYEAVTELPTAGEWQTTIDVSGPAGAGSASFMETVLPPQGINWTLVAGGVAALVVIVGVIGWWSVQQSEDDDDEDDDEEEE